MPIRFLSRLAVAAFALVVLPPAFAQGDAAAADRWHGLSEPAFRHVALPPAIAVTQMAQQDNGFLWLGTQTGLVRWDGYRFRSFNADPQTPGALPDGLISTLHKDPRGRIWIGTSAGGLAWLDEARDRFVPLPKGPEGLSDVGVLTIQDDGAGGLWIGDSAGLDHLAPDGTTVRRHAGYAHLAGLPDGEVHAVLVDRSGGLWVGTRNGLYRRASPAGRFEGVRFQRGGGDLPFVDRIIQDHLGRIWIGTRGQGAFTIAPGQSLPEPVRDTESTGTSGLASDAVLEILEVADDEVWLGIDSGGIVRVDTRSWRTHRIRHHDKVTASLADDEVACLYRDRSGLVWVGTGHDLSSVDPKQQTVSNWFGYAGGRAGVSYPNLPSVLAMPDETAWLGLGDGGVDIVDPVRGRIAQLRPDPLHPLSALPRGRVLAMAMDASGSVWLGTQQGLYRADRSGRRVRRVEVPGRKATVATWAVFADGDRLWLGGIDGLWGMRITAAGTLQPRSGGEGGRLGDERVNTLFEAPGHTLWIGTRAGLVHYDPKTGAIERPGQDTANRIGLPPGYITAVVTDRRGRLWVSSFGAGVRIVDPPRGGGPPVVHRVSTAEGLQNNGVDSMLLDAQGNAWVSTDDGLARIDGADLSVTALRIADGVGIQSYWANASAMLPSGAMLFGGVGGLTIVNPRRMQPWSYSAPVVVTELAGDPDPAARWRGGAPQTLQLQPGKRDLQVEFAALDYSAPELNRYAYRLNGFDNDWITTDESRRSARYTNLPPGDYVLDMRGSNRAGAWSAPLSWPVHVVPTWYETGWFRVAASLAALALIAAVVQLRTLVLRRREVALQELVAERTAELRQRGIELQASERRLEQMAYFDGLTSLGNRRLFNDDVKRLLAQPRRGAPFSLLLIDLDRFKLVNDTLGHDAGDALLQMVAGRLKAAVRDVDRVARLGGDEFAILLPDIADPASIGRVCGRIIESLAQPHAHRGQMLQTSASIGAASCPADGASAEDLYKAADMALYEAKACGRNGWRRSGHEMLEC